MFGIELIENTWLEVMTLTMSFLFGFLAIGISYKKDGNKRPLVLFLTGFSFLLLDILLHVEEWWFIAPAASLIVAAHV